MKGKMLVVLLIAVSCLGLYGQEVTDCENFGPGHSLDFAERFVRRVDIETGLTLIPVSRQGNFEKRLQKFAIDYVFNNYFPGYGNFYCVNITAGRQQYVVYILDSYAWLLYYTGR